MSPQGRPLTARAIARVMHGVASPAYPADQWSKCGFWGRYADVDFGVVQRTAERVLSAVTELG
jgi:ATP-dependent DNA helicase Q4